MELNKSHYLKIYDVSNALRGGREIEYETFVFSGGEVHVKIKDPFPFGVAKIVTRINNSEDLMRLILAVDALRRMGVGHISAFIPYLPYARQDRVMVKGEPLSTKVFASIINGLKLNRITCYDPHSDVSMALLDNSQFLTNFDEVDRFIKYHCGDENLLVVAPDAGAYKKIYKMCTHIGYEGEIIVANKVRDLNTGAILSTQIHGEVKRRNCLIADDIIDGGKTFVELAISLKEKGAEKLYLFASHGIFSKGYDELLKHYTIIGTTDSIQDEYPEPIKVMEIDTTKTT